MKNIFTACCTAIPRVVVPVRRSESNVKTYETRQRLLRSWNETAVLLVPDRATGVAPRATIAESERVLLFYFSKTAVCSPDSNLVSETDIPVSPLSNIKCEGLRAFLGLVPAISFPRLTVGPHHHYHLNARHSRSMHSSSRSLLC